MKKVVEKCNVYKISTQWVAFEVIKIFFIILSISKLFFDSYYASIIVLPIVVKILHDDFDAYIDKQKGIIKNEFKTVIEMISGNLNAGYSLENAIIQSTIDIEKEKNTYEYLDKEMMHMANGLKCNKRVEEMISFMGEKWDIYEIKEFGELVGICKKYGGNMISLIKQARDNINQNNMLELEVSTVLSAKRMEGMIMIFMPFAIMAYMRLTNEEYISPLYEEMFGRGVMVVCLFFWYLSYYSINTILKKIDNV